MYLTKEQSAKLLELGYNLIDGVKEQFRLEGKEVVSCSRKFVAYRNCKAQTYAYWRPTQVPR